MSNSLLKLTSGSVVELDRKILAELAVHEPAAFKEIAAQAKVGLEEKAKQQAS